MSLAATMLLMLICLGFPAKWIDVHRNKALPHSGDVQRMAWFRDVRFGMFIRFELYAVPAGRHVVKISILDKPGVAVFDFKPLILMPKE